MHIYIYDMFFCVIKKYAQECISSLKSTSETLGPDLGRPDGQWGEPIDSELLSEPEKTIVSSQHKA